MEKEICKTCVSENKLISPAADTTCDDCNDNDKYVEHLYHRLERELKEAIKLLDEWDNDYDTEICCKSCDCVWCKTRRFLESRNDKRCLNGK